MNQTNVKAKTVQLLENIKTHFYKLVLGNSFLAMTPKTQATKAKYRDWISSKSKTFVLQKAPSRK